MNIEDANDYRPKCPICQLSMTESHRRMPPTMNGGERFLYFEWHCHSETLNGDSHAVTIRKKSDTP